MAMNSVEDEKALEPKSAVAAWIDKGFALAQAASGHQWAIADWMLWGEEHILLKQAYDIAERATGYKRKTLQEWAYVARHVSIRMENLTFGHHQAVAALLPEAQKRCLEHAAAQSPVMPIGDLREMVRWQPRPLEIDLEHPNAAASILLKFFDREELDCLEITARQRGFISDDKNSAIGRLVRQLIVEFLEANPELRASANNEYGKRAETRAA